MKSLHAPTGLYESLQHFSAQPSCCRLAPHMAHSRRITHQLHAPPSTALVVSTRRQRGTAAWCGQRRCVVCVHHALHIQHLATYMSTFIRKLPFTSIQLRLNFDALIVRSSEVCSRTSRCRTPRQRLATAQAAAGSGDTGGRSEPGDERDGDGLAAVADRLSLAVAAEDYERAAVLRDELA